MVVRATVVHALPTSLCTCTAAFGSKGRASPVIDRWSLEAAMRTNGATDSRTTPLRISPIESR